MGKITFLTNDVNKNLIWYLLKLQTKQFNIYEMGEFGAITSQVAKFHG